MPSTIQGNLPEILLKADPGLVQEEGTEQLNAALPQDLPELPSKNEILNALGMIPQHPDFFEEFLLSDTQKETIATFALACLNQPSLREQAPLWIRSDLEASGLKEPFGMHYFPEKRVLYILPKKLGPQKPGQIRGHVGEGAYQKVEFCLRLCLVCGLICAEVAVASLKKTNHRSKKLARPNRDATVEESACRRADRSDLFALVDGKRLPFLDSMNTQRHASYLELEMRKLSKVEKSIEGPHSAISYGDFGFYLNNKGLLRSIFYSPFYGINLEEIIFPPDRAFWGKFWAHALVEFIKASPDFLSLLQEKSVFHRDLKLQNILYGPDKVIRFCDFGLSTLTKEGDKLNWDVGTPATFSPELAKCARYVKYREPPKITFHVDWLKSDIWAMGISLVIFSARKIDEIAKKQDGSPFGGVIDFLNAIHRLSQAKADEFIGRMLEGTGTQNLVQPLALNLLKVDRKERWDGPKFEEEVKKIPEATFTTFLAKQKAL